MPDSKAPATGALIMEQVLQVDSTTKQLLQLAESHASAAIAHRKAELQALEDLTKDTHYYGDQLIRAYHTLNTKIRQMSERLDAALEEREPTI